MGDALVTVSAFIKAECNTIWGDFLTRYGDYASADELRDYHPDNRRFESMAAWVQALGAATVLLARRRERFSSN